MKSGIQVWKKAIVGLLIISLITPIARAEQTAPAASQERLVPDAGTMFNAPPSEYVKAPEDIDPELKTRLESQLNLSIQSVFEAFFLNSGLYLTYQEQERRYGREVLMQRLMEKSDELSVKYDIEGIGKAELILLGRGKKQIPVTMIRLNSGRYVLFLDTSQYDPEIFKENVPENLTPRQIELELKLRSITKGLVHGLISQILIFAKNEDAKIPLHEFWQKSLNGEALSQQQIKEEIARDIDPLAQRYKELESEMERIEVTDAQYEKLLAEKEVIEEAVLKLRNNPSSIWAKMVQTGASTLSSKEGLLGMPVTVIYHNQGQFLNSQNIEKPHEDTFKDSLHKWATYSKALNESIHFDWETWYNSDGLSKLNAFKKGDPYYTWYNTRWQIPLAMTSGYLLLYLGHGAPNFGAMGLNSLVWGVVVGMNIRRFLNWTLSGTEFSKMMKDTFLGLAFGVTAYMFDPTKTLADVSMLTWGSIIGSQILKNTVKKGPREYQSFKKRAGLTRGEYSTPLEKHYIDWRRANGSIAKTWEVKVPFKLVRKLLENSVGLRTEQVGSINREIKKDAILSTEMTINSFIPKTLMSFNILLFPVYAAMGPYWELRSVEDKEANAASYARQHGEGTPKAKFYKQEALEARKQWEKYRLITAEDLLRFGIDVRGSKFFEKGIVLPSQYAGYYVKVVKELIENAEKFFSEKSINRRIQEYVSNAYLSYKIRQKTQEVRTRNIINMAYPLQRKAPATGSCRTYFS